jgi:hypothetical protein
MSSRIEPPTEEAQEKHRVGYYALMRLERITGERYPDLWAIVMNPPEELPIEFFNGLQRLADSVSISIEAARRSHPLVKGLKL